MRVALLSLEPWDDVWRRNQHLATRLVRDGAVTELLFLQPPRDAATTRGPDPAPPPHIRVLTPPPLVARRWGAQPLLGRWARRAIRDVDLVWINDPLLGVATLRRGRRTVYDVSEDGRESDLVPAHTRAVIAAQDELARRAVRTIVCSGEPHRRWLQRYRLDARIVPNGFDAADLAAAYPLRLAGADPHVVYVGTLHRNRLDLQLLHQLAAQALTMHLVGPDHLSAAERTELVRAGIRLAGPVAPSRVASWLKSADVLICPHRVDQFTLSLDAIQTHEYLATDRLVVATPTSGFQGLTAPGLAVSGRAEFVAAVQAAAVWPNRLRAAGGRPDRPNWDQRAREFKSAINGLRF